MLPHVERQRRCAATAKQGICRDWQHFNADLLNAGCLIPTASVRYLSQKDKALQDENGGLPYNLLHRWRLHATAEVEP